MGKRRFCYGSPIDKSDTSEHDRRYFPCIAVNCEYMSGCVSLVMKRRNLRRLGLPQAFIGGVELSDREKSKLRSMVREE